MAEKARRVVLEDYPADDGDGDFPERRRRRCMAVADAEIVRLGIARAAEAMDWLGDQTEGMLETRLDVFEMEHGSPMIHADGSWWVGVEERRLEGEHRFFAGTSKARMMWVARQMLDEFRERFAPPPCPAPSGSPHAD